MSLLLCIYGRNHNLLEWLANLDVDLAAQCQHHGRNLLCYGHALLEVVVYGRLIGHWEHIQMYALQLAAKVVIQLIGIERSERREQLGYSHQAGIESLIGTELVLTHLLAPETLAVQANIPVGEVVIDRSVYRASCTCRVIAR